MARRHETGSVLFVEENILADDKADDICCNWCFKGKTPLDVLDTMEA